VSSRLAVLTTLAEGSAEKRREAARQAYRESVALGEPVSSQALAEQYERSRTWARERIAEVRSEDGMPPQDGVLGDATEKPDQTPACHPATTAPEAAVETEEDRVDSPTVAAPSEGVATTETPGMPRTWPVLLLALPAFVAIWGGWVGLGELAGFGPIRLLPGIADSFVINSAITLPIGVEVYAAYALRVWLGGIAPTRTARLFAMTSAIGSLVLGMVGQVGYHLMVAAGMTKAPWQITTFVSCLPVVVLGCGAALAHLLHDHGRG
jgi:hypothetical protein